MHFNVGVQQNVDNLLLPMLVHVEVYEEGASEPAYPIMTVEGDVLKRCSSVIERMMSKDWNGCDRDSSSLLKISYTPASALHTLCEQKPNSLLLS